MENQEIKVHYSNKLYGLNCDNLVNINHVFNVIRNGSQMVTPKIVELRNIGKYYENGEQKADFSEGKVKLPVWYPSAIFKGGMSDINIVLMTGLVYLDIDIKPSEINKLNDIANKLRSCQYTYALWQSVSSYGYGCLVKVDNLTPENYRSVWDWLLKAYELKFDTKTRKPSAKTFISFDPNLFINPNSVTLDANQIINRQEGQSSRIYTKKKKKEKKIIIHECLDPIKEFHPPITNVTLKMETALPDEFYNEFGVAFFPEGRLYAKVFLNKRCPILEGSRNMKLGAICCTLMFNNSIADSEDIIRFLQFINTNYVRPPLTSKEIENIFNNNKRKWEKGILNYVKTFKKIWFAPWCSIPKEERQKYVNKLMGQTKSKETKVMIENVVNELIMQKKKITKRNISNITGISNRTVSRYWKDWADKIRIHNDLLRKHKSERIFKELEKHIDIN